MGQRLADIALVVAGGFIGGVSRYVIGLHWQPAAGQIPWNIFTVNVAGVFILSALVGWLGSRSAAPRRLRPLIGIGFCGALTTFGSVMIEVDELATHNHAAVAVEYLSASLIASVIAAAIAARVVSR